MNYMVKKEVSRIQDNLQEVEKAADGCKILLNYIDEVENYLNSKEDDELDISKLQRHLIKIAALSIHLSTNVCYVA